MKKLLLISASILLVIGVLACERPGSPDFEINHELDIPLSKEKTYPFMGGDEALIDSTSEDYEDFFSSDTEGMVHVTNEEEFDFGDLDDAIPDVDADPTTTDAEVGEIELTNFASKSPVGKADFDALTGASGSNFNENDQVPPQPANPPVVNIDLETDYFKSAVIKEDGTLKIEMTNNLGFHLDYIEVTLNSDDSAVDNGTIPENSTNDFTHNSTESINLDISEGTTLEDVNVDVQAFWDDNETMEDDAGELVVDEVTGQDLVASEVEAAVESQSFNENGKSQVDQSSFEFRETDHFVELGGGELVLDINSSLNIKVEDLDIVFHDIEDESGNELTIPTIEVEQKGSYDRTIDLSGHRIKAHNGELDYSIEARTENMQQGEGSETRTINEKDGIKAEVDLSNLEISRAEGYIVPDLVMLNTDQTIDGQENIDIFNDDEAETIDIDGINDISDRISGLVFENPVLSTLYTTNLGVNTTIYAVIAGTDNNGNTEFLTGKDGSPYKVNDDEIPSELEVNGQPATADQVIKFMVDPVENPDPENGELGSNEFNASNTNSSPFFNSLPNSIRFVGAAKVNNGEEEGTIVNPVIFEPTMGFDLPLDFSADNATFEDTLEADLGDLPGEDDDQSLKSAKLTLNYTNALPLDLDLVIIMLDENGQEVTHKGDIAIDEAGVGENGYVNDPSESVTEISFDEDNLNQLNRTRDIKLEMMLNTPDTEAVRIRKDDFVTLRIKIEADITTTVN